MTFKVDEKQSAEILKVYQRCRGLVSSCVYVLDDMKREIGVSVSRENLLKFMEERGLPQSNSMEVTTQLVRELYEPCRGDPFVISRRIVEEVPYFLVSAKTVKKYCRDLGFVCGNPEVASLPKAQRSCGTHPDRRTYWNGIYSVGPDILRR